MMNLSITETIRLHRLRREIAAGERNEFDPDKRFRFARYLYQHGYINDGKPTLCPCGYPDNNACPCLTDEPDRIAHETEVAIT